MPPLNMTAQSRVLLVHSDARAYVELTTLLQDNGYQVLTSPLNSSGELGALFVAQNEEPDLVLIQVSSSTTSEAHNTASAASSPTNRIGAVLCQTLRADPELQYMPIIITAAHPSDDDTLLGYQSGIDDYIDLAKPREELLLRLRRPIQKYKEFQALRAETAGHSDTAGHRQEAQNDDSIHRQPASVRASEQQTPKNLLDKRLTDREKNVLQLFVDGHSRKTIAQEMNITENTVRWYLKSIYNKLGISSKVEAIAEAREMGL